MGKHTRRPENTWEQALDAGSSIALAVANRAADAASHSKNAKSMAAPSGVVLCTALGSTLLAPVGASAAESPQIPKLPQAPVLDASLPTPVAGDLLPTPQINGVAWVQKIASGKVYVGGSFTSARPFKVPAGQQETKRSNLLAYDLKTGKLVASFAPAVNGQVRSMETSPDGKTLYVGGDFTEISGQKRYRLAAFDVATGALKQDFAPQIDYRVNAIATRGNTVFFGGKFSVVNGQKRSNLAAVDATTGATLSWAPQSNHQVMGMALSPNGEKIVVGGQMSSLNGTHVGGWGCISTSTGATLPWIGHRHIRNSGNKDGITSVHGTKDGVFITGYSFNPENPLPFEGLAKARWSDGKVEFVNGTRGDSYDVTVMDGVAYSVSHMHDGSPIGGLPNMNPWKYQRAYASTASASPLGRKNASGDFWGTPSGEMLHWWPKVAAGTFTGQNQGAWSIESADGYVVMGGEFPRVNGTFQNGLARFAKRSVAASKRGPEWPVEAPKVIASAGPRVEIESPGAWDVDSTHLTYELLRDGVPVAAVKQEGKVWWNTSAVRLVDTGAVNGKHAYSVRIVDEDGNYSTTKSVDVETVGGLTEARNVAPEAAFTSSVQDLTVSLDASASKDHDGKIVSYSWDLGNGVTADAAKTVFTYPAAGTYTIVLTVTDDAGAQHQSRRLVTVSAPVVKPEPVVVTPVVKPEPVVVTPVVKPEPVKPAPVAKPEPVKPAPVAKPAPVVKPAPVAKPEPVKPAPVAKPEPVKPAPVAKPAPVVKPEPVKPAPVVEPVPTLKPTTGSKKSSRRPAVAPHVPATPGTTSKSASRGTAHQHSDRFARSAVAGWNAPGKSAYRIVGNANNLAVEASQGVVTVGQRDLAGALVAHSNSSQTRSMVSLQLEALPKDGPLYVSVVGRQVDNSQYRARVLFLQNGAVRVAVQRVQGATVVTLAEQEITQNYQPGQKLVVGFNALGTGTTSLSATYSLDNAPTQALQATDNAAELQQSGTYGLMAYGSGRMQNETVSVKFDDYLVAAK